MSTIAVLDLEFKPDQLDAARTVMRRVLVETRNFDGCLGVEAFQDPENSARWVLFERWASPEHDAAYRTFRAGPGAITDLATLLAAAPSLKMFTEPIPI